MFNWLITKEALDYKIAENKMLKLHHQVKIGETPPTIWLLEHQPVITLGTSGKQIDVFDNSIPMVVTGRGGKATYHGPGQRIVYLMLNLKDLFKGKIDIRKFVFALEQWIISVLLEIGLKSKVHEDRVGIWIDTPGRFKPYQQAKIAALGIRVSGGVSMHGIAINVKPNLAHFNYINPCGLKEYGVTSLFDLGYEIEYSVLDQILQKKFNLVLEICQNS